MTAAAPPFGAMKTGCDPLHCASPPVAGSRAYSPPEPVAKSFGPRARNETAAGTSARHDLRVTLTLFDACAEWAAASDAVATSVRVLSSAAKDAAAVLLRFAEALT